MDKQPGAKEVTLTSIAEQLDRIEQRLNQKEIESKKAKDWKDLQELGGLLLLVTGLIYLFVIGGFSAIFEWVKNLIIPG